MLNKQKVPSFENAKLSFQMVAPFVFTYTVSR